MIAFLDTELVLSEFNEADLYGCQGIIGILPPVRQLQN